MNRAPLRWLFFVLAFSPAVLPLALVLKFGYNMHVQDEWDPHIAGLNISLHDHKLTFHDLYRQHNEHRILLPRLAFLGLAAVSHWNEKWELVAEWVVVALTSLGIFWLCAFAFRSSADPPHDWSRVLGAWFIANLLIFTPAAWENWMWGMGLANVMPMAFIVATLVVICSGLRTAIKIPLAIVCALMATYSSGNGMLVWPLAGLVLAWPWTLRSWMDRKWELLAWFIAGCVIVGTYYIGYQKPDHRGAHPYATSIGSFLAYLPVFLGSPFAFAINGPAITIARLLGWIKLILFVGAVVVLIVRWKDSDSADSKSQSINGRLLIGLMIASFGLLSGVIASYSRAGLGLQQAVGAARYVSFALYLPVGLILMGHAWFAELISHTATSPARRLTFARIGASAATLIVALSVLAWPAAIFQFRGVRMLRLQAKAALLLLDAMPNNPATVLIFPDLSVVYDQAPRFEQLGYVSPKPVASRRARDIEVSDASSLHEPRGQIDQLDRISPTEIRAAGWAAFTQKSAPADAVLLAFDRGGNDPMFFAMPKIGQSRSDVAAALDDDGVELCGWEIVFPSGMLPDDGHGLTITAWAFDVDEGKAFRLSNPVRIP